METSFYSAGHAASLREKNRKWNRVFVIVCALTAAACLGCALGRTTLNAARMETLATVLLTLGGWAAIAVWDCALRPNRTLREHEERILAAEEEARNVSGKVTLQEHAVRIAQSINVRRVSVETAEGTESFLISEDFAAALSDAAASGPLTLRVTEGYVTGVVR